MNIDELRNLLNAHGICEKLDDFDLKGLPDLLFASGGHAILIFTEGGELQEQFMKRISNQLAPHFIWNWLDDRGCMKQYDSIDDSLYIYTLTDHESVVLWLDYIEEENKDFDYLEKYSEES